MFSSFVLLLSLIIAGIIGGSMFWAFRRHYSLAAKANEKLSNREIIALAQRSGGQLTVGKLLSESSLNAQEAQAKLQELTQVGILRVKYRWWKGETLYLLNDSVILNLKMEEAPTPLKKQTSASLPDAEVIRLAVETGGKLTPALLCLKAKISIDEAQAVLGRLYQKEVFTLEVTEGGAVAYVLMDKEMY